MNDTLKNAIAYLGAVPIAADRYAFLDGSFWYTIGPDELALVNTEGERESTLDWLAARGYRVEMPVWWSPERQFAAISTNGVTCPGPSIELLRATNVGAMIVTVNLKNGEEIPA